jgi:demethylmenaquinone methyltransferase/2-methoxy-6-polyprenyl-1,4-benzoquinol methylase
MTIESSMAGYYARRASEYERIYLKPQRQEDLQRLRDCVERACAGAHVLEIACGTGYWTAVAARSGSSVLAVDINDEVLSIARSKPMGPAAVTFARGDAYSLPDYSRRFTLGLGAFWWSHIPKPRLPAFLQDFHRQLLPGARVMFIDNVYVEGSSTPICRADEQGDTYQVRKLDDGSTHEVLKNFPSDQDLHMAVNGLSVDVRVERLQYYWIWSYEPKTRLSGA